METRTVYLKSYDLYAEILEYSLPEGKFAVLPREQFELRGIALAFGDFSREGDQVAGVFASPEGPVFFLNEKHLVGRFGRTTASVDDLAVAFKRRRMYRLTHREESGEETDLVLVYDTRLGIGANPYDNEEEDIDLFALIASGIRGEQFFRNYTRAWE